MDDGRMEEEKMDEGRTDEEKMDEGKMDEEKMDEDERIGKKWMRKEMGEGKIDVEVDLVISQSGNSSFECHHHMDEGKIGRGKNWMKKIITEKKRLKNKKNEW